MSDERWLLTFADMITLLMALFMVLFSISSVNNSKLDVAAAVAPGRVLGRVLPGGKALMESGSETSPKRAAADAAAPVAERR